eukprot:TRINITY_DN8197_c0_g1_i2.p1 TRINITY_DN8197_c0_g1~~TRINITY_DN8197_c0_g1_i2.p1  ORF type:complete len:191 (-),score=31.99 TRINITY_DN8197_c0_g1_i2:67-639(-)
MDEWNKRLENELPEKLRDTISLEDRIRIGVQLRLSYLEPVLHKWPEAMYIGLDPRNIATTVQKLWRAVDIIWHSCGDRSFDTSYYTRRVILFKIYVSTELYMLTDKSEGHRETWSFLRRRIEDTINIGQYVSGALLLGDTVWNAALNLMTVVRGFPSSVDNPISQYKETLDKMMRRETRREDPTNTEWKR